MTMITRHFGDELRDVVMGLNYCSVSQNDAPLYCDDNFVKS